MPFEYTMANLLANVDSAVGVLFLDESGETVDLACAEYSPYDMKIVAAYLGIYLRQLRQTLTGAEIGDLRILHIARGGLHIHACLLPDDYALALIQKPPVLVAPARRALAVAAEEVRREVFVER
ncbi:MAG: hypothetical protein AAF481_11895 [Acidobacteriota bacterium]